MFLNIISGPRNVSTALMYSFAQRKDTHVIDEPYYASYLAKTGIDHPGKEAVLEAQSADSATVTERLTGGQYDKPIVFIKNMAHHLAEFDNDVLKDMRNVFLIRDPREMLLSLIKKIPGPKISDTAYPQQYRLFRYVTHTLDQPPLVIDSAELLKNPPGVLQKLCSKLEIDFDENMLRWEPGPLPEDGVWAEHWYASVHESMGFNPYTPKKGPVPERLEPMLENCKNYYVRMYKHAIKAKDS
jgi:hypothetical protein